jgi:hypothetical protein
MLGIRLVRSGRDGGEVGETMETPEERSEIAVGMGDAEAVQGVCDEVSVRVKDPRMLKDTRRKDDRLYLR